MRSGRFFLGWGLWAAMAATTCPAQTATPQTTAAIQSTKNMSDQDLALAVANSLGPAGIVPRTTGFNASVISSSQYDSITGWANILTPSLAWRFNRYVSADVATPLFLYMRSQRVVQPTTGPPYTDTTIRHGLPGDTTMALHLSSKSFSMGKLGDFNDVLTGSLAAPTGSVEDGIGAGKVTYNVTNHLQSASFLAPYVDLGIGSTSRLQNRRVQRSQTSRGELANFGVGVSLELPRASTLYLEGYEQLPLGTQTVYQVDPRSGRPDATQNSNGLAEDNGINLSLDVPLAPHLTWSAFYSRGLRLHEDTVGFAFTMLLRNPMHKNTDR
ncbi:hypothetical protein SAMN05444167_0090 [Terriglobus roseus]|uniref:MetA-pathway of phenol degradation n=2 Tax=Terriglobus roseus TaxID=392734 RepID=A0A1G7ETZ5_9BACT|nr:hypothetical protein SAMN05444167_0090 [Terriglobus roseus]